MGGTGDQVIVSRYLTADGTEYEVEALKIPEGTVAALIAAILERVDQNERPDILREETRKDEEIQLKRMTAMGRTLDPNHPLTGPILRMGNED
ncbi:hypothetical protein ACFXHK_25865 [Embleya sp. NPDC059267]